jgi:hypothetical protein
MQYLIVRGTLRDLRDGNHVVARFPQRPDNGSGAALVGHKVHALGSVGILRAWEQHYFFVGYAGCPIGYCGANIFRGEVWVIFVQFGLGGAFPELPQYQLNGDSRSADHRFSHHNLRINNNSIARHRNPPNPSYPLQPRVIGRKLILP